MPALTLCKAIMSCSSVPPPPNKTKAYINIPADYCLQFNKYAYVFCTVKWQAKRMGNYISTHTCTISTRSTSWTIDCEGSYAEEISKGLDVLQSLESNG